MEEVPGLFGEFGEDPVGQAVDHAHWWLVNRIRTRAEAEDVLKVARECLGAAVRGQTSVRGIGARQALDLIGDAVGSWDTSEPAHAERLDAWESLDAALASIASRTAPPHRRTAIEIGRLFLGALREAYTIQKMGNRAAETWSPTHASWPTRPDGAGDPRC